MEAPEISIVVPVYNSEESIGELVRLMSEELEGKHTYEFVLVDDGSKDGSHRACKLLAESNPRVKFISFFRNFGQLSAILAGLREAEGEIVVVMDDDLQNPPSEVHKLIKKIREGYDFVFGRPEGKMQQSFSRRFGSYVSVRMAEIVFGKPKGLYASSYYAITRGVAREVVKYDGPFPYISGFIFRTTSNGCNVDVEHHPRKYGKSGYSYRKLIMLLLSGFTNFSILPLRVATYLGVASASAGFLFLVWIVIRKLMAPQLISAGWTSVLGMILFFAGIQLLALGMLGEYVGRVFLLVNKSPQYTVREKFNCRDDDGA